MPNDKVNKIQQFVETNWSRQDVLRSLIGKPCQTSMEWTFGCFPPERDLVETQDGVIVRVSTWSGQFWTVRGYGAPIVIAE